jgi:hypothetical protein
VTHITGALIGVGAHCRRILLRGASQPEPQQANSIDDYRLSLLPQRVIQGMVMAKHRIYTTSFASVYPLYLAKAEKKGRTKAEVDQVISWLTGYGQKQLEAQLEQGTDFETFFAKAPKINPSRALIKGVVCGVRVEDVKEPTMREIRYLDKLIDELAKGKAMDKILRKSAS